MMALERSYSNEDEAELARSNFSARAKYGNQDLGVSQQGLLQMYRVDSIQVISTLASSQGTSTSSPGARNGTCLA